ncbi:hypothetical protein JTB14_009635 [Gonioctena quinquepunctata]|nr:hypothetical protein JTB14_009635 [Gonioctena quinquepunctata]
MLSILQYTLGGREFNSIFNAVLTIQQRTRVANTTRACVEKIIRNYKETDLEVKSEDEIYIKYENVKTETDGESAEDQSIQDGIEFETLFNKMQWRTVKL